MNAKNWLLLLLLIATIGFTASAQSGQGPDRKNKELARELKQYRKQNIRPVMLAKRQAFDMHLSEAERQEIHAVRLEVTNLRKKQAALSKQWRAERQNNQGPLTAEQKAAMAALRAARKQQMERLAPIGRKHAAALQTVADELKEEQGKWREDIKAILSKYGVSPDSLNLPGKRRPFWDNLLPRWRAAQFLLLNPNASVDSVPGKASLFQVQVNPNPVTDRATISFTLPQAGPVKVEILDGQGQAVVTLLNKSLKAGSHIETLRAQSLGSGVYFCRIATAQGTEAFRFLKQ